LTGRRISAILLGENTMLSRIKREFEQGKTLVTFTSLQATGQALGMIVPLVVAKVFSPELFGSFSLANMILFFFLTLAIASSQTPFIVFANEERGRSGKISKTFSVQCTFLVASFCIFVAIILLFNKQVTLFVMIDRVDMLFVLLAFAGLSLKSFLCNLFMAMGQRIKCSFAELAFSGLTLSLVLVLCLARAISLRTVFLTYLVSALVVVCIFAKNIDFNQLLPFNFDKGHFKEMFNFTKWIMLGATSVYFINWGDNLVLRLYVSMDDIGTYNLAYQVFKSALSLTFVAPAYFLPFVSQHIHDRRKMREYLFKKRPRILLLGVAAIAVFFVVGPLILRMIYADKYAGSSTILRILLVGLVPTLHAVLHAPILNALKKYRFTQTVNMFQVALNVILNLLLVPSMGLTGAAVATVVAYWFQAAIIEIYYRCKLKKQLEL
jgi:O-antigen/teichoic acid export membrane protein